MFIRGRFGHLMFDFGMIKHLTWSIGGLELCMLSLEEYWHDAWSLEKLYRLALHLGGGAWMMMSQGLVLYLMMKEEKINYILILAREVRNPMMR